MYAQYQQYQQQSNQYQQAATGGGAAVWNGTSWVYPSNNMQQQQQQQQQQQVKPQIIPRNPVQTFTQYYHGWMKREEVLKNQVMNGRTEAERQTAESNRKWAKYYAEESSRAAHHFHQYPHATSAPFDLPPAPPPPTTIEITIQNRNTDNTDTKITQKRSTNKKNAQEPSSNSSGSVTRYVRRNIERKEVATDPKLKAYVQSQVEIQIASALQKGDLQSRNWDLEPLITLPFEKAEGTTGKSLPEAPSNNRFYQQENQPVDRGIYRKNSRSISPENRNDGNSSSRCNYYGPAAASPSSNNSPKKLRGEADASASYYGPASSHNNNSNRDSQYRDNIRENSHNTLSSSHFTGKSKNRKRSNHYLQQNAEEDFIPFGSYGPSSSSSPETSNTSNKKSKKWHRKNKTVAAPTTAVVTMYNEGMDYSQQTMDKRASRFSGRGGIHDASIANYRSSSGIHNNSKNDRYMGKGTIGGSNKTLDENDFEKMTVKGTSTTLEKEYLRLTAPPRAEFVRPFHILKQHLRNLQSEYYCCRDPEKASDDRNTSTILQERMKKPQENWHLSEFDKSNKEKNQNPRRKHDYLWFCSQLKAIRQDCTVQRIQGDLAVDVYETHARIALQEGDLNE